MKLYVYRELVINRIIFSESEGGELGSRRFEYLGAFELDIKPEKKVVTREVSGYRNYYGCVTPSVAHEIPNNAKNIKITYEIEE